MFSTNSSKLGVDLTQASSTQNFAVGDTIRGSDGSIWQYACAATTVSAYAVVAINASGSMNMATLTALDNSSGGYQLAVAQFAFAPSDYGWVPVHGVGGPGGTFKVLVSGSSSAGVALYVAGSGRLSITAAASGTIAGIAIVSGTDTANTAVTATPCIITWPKTRSLGQ